jgi:DNA-binding NarL/FixJ family response regulator
VLVDVELPGLSGIDALPKLKKVAPDAHFLILTVYEQDLLIFRALGAVQPVTSRRILRPEKLIAAIRDVMGRWRP